VSASGLLGPAGQYMFAISFTVSLLHFGHAAASLVHFLVGSAQIYRHLRCPRLVLCCSVGRAVCCVPSSSPFSLPGGVLSRFSRSLQFACRGRSASVLHLRLPSSLARLLPHCSLCFFFRLVAVLLLVVPSLRIPSTSTRYFLWISDFLMFPW
jgi:hypothetical protein